MRRAARCILVLALSLSIGLQWALVQGVGWMQMVVEFSREASLLKSVAMTLGGKHPCRLCKAAQQGDTGAPAKKSASAKELEPAEKEEGLVIVATPSLIAPDVRAVFRDGEKRVRPPSPPPRLAV